MFKKIGQRIRKVRLEHGIKQKDLAKKINISQGALTNFELGRRKISLEWLLKISHALEVPVGYFMSAVEPPPEEDTLEHEDVRSPQGARLKVLKHFSELLRHFVRD